MLSASLQSSWQLALNGRSLPLNVLVDPLLRSQPLPHSAVKVYCRDWVVLLILKLA